MALNTHYFVKKNALKSQGGPVLLYNVLAAMHKAVSPLDMVSHSQYYGFLGECYWEDTFGSIIHLPFQVLNFLLFCIAPDVSVVRLAAGSVVCGRGGVLTVVKAC